MFATIEFGCYNAPDMIKEAAPSCAVCEQKREGQRLREWLETHRIQAVLFDFDDTLLDTNTHINEHKARYIDYLSDRLPDIPRQSLHEAVEQADYDIFATHSVSKDRWDGAIGLMVTRFPEASQDVFRDGAAHLHAMYVSSPRLLPGAKETVAVFREASSKLGLVTHADYGWTMLKLKRSGFESVFDHIQVVDQYKNKAAEDWVKAIEALGVKPEDVLVIGDSVKGDIQAAYAAGVRHLIALPSPWEKYREGDLPPGTIEARSIAGVIHTLLAR